MKSTFFTVCFMLVFSLCQSQSISGKIENLQGQPLEAALISLMDTTNTMQLQSAETDSTGAFCFEQVPKGLYQIRIAYIDKELLTMPVSIDGDTDLHTLLVDDTHSLTGVEIIAHKSLMEFKSGKYTFTPSIQSAGSAEDLLKSVPMLSLNDEVISIIGKGAAKVMINGKWLRMDKDQLIKYIRSIPAVNIEKIEIIRTPHAETDAENKNGSVNLILKKQQGQGIAYGMNGSYREAMRGSGSAGGTLNVHHSNIQVYAMANAGKSNSMRLADNHIFYTRFNAYQRQQSATISSEGSATAGLDFSPGDRTSAGASLSYNMDNRKAEERFENYYSNLLSITDSFSLTDSKDNIRSQSITANAYAEHTLDSAGEKIRLDADYFITTQYARQVFDNFFYNSAGNTIREPSSYRSDNTGSRCIASANLVYDLPWNQFNYKLGAKATFINSNNKNEFFKKINDHFVADKSQYDQFAYTENTQALFLSGNGMISKWSFDLGVRAEFTQTRGRSVNGTTWINKHYLKFFPAAGITYTKDQDHTCAFNYNRSIDRPILAMVNPFRKYAGENIYGQGNPSLQPYTTHNVELNYIWKRSWTGLLGYSASKDVYGEITRVADQNLLQVSVAENFFDLKQFMMGLSGVNNFFKGHLVANTGAYLIHSSVKSHTDVVKSAEQWYIYLMSSCQWSIGEKKNVLIDTSAYFVSSNQIGAMDMKSVFGANAGLTVLFLEKRLKLNLAANDIFKTQSMRYSSMVNGINRDRFVYNDTRNVKLSVRYDLSKGVKKDIKRNDSFDQDKNRARS